MTEAVGFLMFTSAVIFGGRNIFKRWMHKQRMRRNDRRKRRQQELYNRRFRLAQQEIENWRRETEPAREKHLNIICKNPAIAPAFK